ncbi:hypothetical protein ACFL6F_00705 [Planctomycetota bacterium]
MKKILIGCVALLLTLSIHAETRAPGAFRSPEKLKEMSTLVFVGTVLKVETVEKYRVSFPTDAKVGKVLKGQLEKREISFKHKNPGRYIIIEKEFNTPKIGQEGTFYIQDQGGTLVLIGYIKTEQIALSLHQREEKGKVVLDILVSNVSTSPVKIVSEGIAPPWSVWAWFKWEIDGRPAEYSENVAGIPDISESWLVPPKGTILWASIPLRSLQHVILNESGQKELRSVIQDTNRHIVIIRPSDRWKDMTVGTGKIEVGKKDTEPKDALDKE